MEILPTPWTYVISLLLGLIVGSFLNVVIYRLPKNLSVVRPRSKCTHCHKPIEWQDNIPVLGYFILHGKCRYCHAPISFQYPVIEILTAVSFLAVRMRLGWTPTLFFREWPFVSLLIAISFIDLKHRIIPDVLSLGGLILGLCTSMAIPGFGFTKAIIGALLGFVSFYLLAWGYERSTGRAGLGGGDIKLLAMIGAFIGPEGVFATVFIGSVLGSLVGIVWAMTAGKKQIMKFSIPFGPFLIVGALYYYLLGDILWFQFMIPT